MAHKRGLMLAILLFGTLSVTNSQAQPPITKDLNSSTTIATTQDQQKELTLPIAINQLAKQGRLNLLIDKIVYDSIKSNKVTTLSNEPPLIELQTLLTKNRLSYVQIDRRAILVVEESQGEPVLSLTDLVTRAEKLDSLIGIENAPARKFVAHDYDFIDEPIANIFTTIANQENLSIEFNNSIAGLLQNKKIDLLLKNVTAPHALQILLESQLLTYKQIGTNKILITIPHFRGEFDKPLVFNSPLEEIITRAEEDAKLANININIKLDKLRPLPLKATFNGTNVISKLASYSNLNIIFGKTEEAILNDVIIPFQLDNISTIRALKLLLDAYGFTFAQVDTHTIKIFQRLQNNRPPVSLEEIVEGGTQQKLINKNGLLPLLDFSFQDQPIKNIVETIAQQLPFNVLFMDAIDKLVETKKVNFEMKGVNAAQALQIFLSNQRFLYQHVDRSTLMIKPEIAANYQYSRPLEDLIEFGGLLNNAYNNSSGHSISLRIANKYKINLLEHDSSLEMVLTKLIEQLKFTVEFGPEIKQLITTSNINLNLQNVSTVAILETLLKEYGLGYKQLNSRALFIYAEPRPLFMDISLAEIVDIADQVEKRGNSNISLKAYDFDFDQIPITEILRTISAKEHLNVIIDQAIEGLLQNHKMDLHLKNSSVPAALEIVIKKSLLGFKQIDIHSIYIGSKSKTSGEEKASISVMAKNYRALLPSGN